MSPPPSTAPAIEVFVRELVPNKNGELDAFLNRLNQLASTGVVADVTVHVVGKQVCPETAALTESGRHICQRIREFRQWAKQTGKQVDEFFPTTDVKSTFTGAEYNTITFPTVAMAEYINDELQFVTPSADGATVSMPRDRLAELTAPAPPAGHS